MIITPLALVVCIVGLLLYIVPTHAKVNELGRIMFAFGLLVVLLIAGGHGGMKIG